MGKVKYAIIGFGGIAENRIAKEGFGVDTSRFAGHAQAELVGVTDVNGARKAAAADLGLKRYSSPPTTSPMRLWRSKLCAPASIA